MNEIAKKVVTMAFDFLEAKYGSNPFAKMALNLVEQAVNKAIDEGLIDHLINRQAFAAPVEE